MKKINVILCIMVLLTGSACSHTKEAASGSTLETPALDLNNFIGERIQLPGEYSSQITQLRLKINFPTGYELLIHANPNAELYAGDGRLVLKRQIELNTLNYVINRKIDAPVFYAKLGIYYCKTGDAGLCMIQNVLYEVHASDSIAPGPLDIEYTVPAANF